MVGFASEQFASRGQIVSADRGNVLDLSAALGTG
jgi:hypothetical protein